ncbi:STAS domain-containing protein [Pseudomonas typographi]|nr:STAS domain-containing protein [Pseudomonas typographi]
MLASVEKTGSGLALAGVLDYRTGAHLREQGRQLLASCEQAVVVVDCSAVEKASSVGVSLLLAFTRDAQAVGKQLKVQAMPTDIQQIADVCGIVELFETV